MCGLFLHSTSWRREFEWPQEVVSFFEEFSNSIGLINQILHVDNAIFTKTSGNPCVICQGNLLLVDFVITTSVDQFIYWLQVWLPPRNMWFHGPWHVKWSIVNLNKGATEDLTKVKKLQRLSDLWTHNTDASDPNDKCQFGLCMCIEAASFSCHPSHQNRSSVHLPILFVRAPNFFTDKLHSLPFEGSFGQISFIGTWSSALQNSFPFQKIYLFSNFIYFAVPVIVAAHTIFHLCCAMWDLLLAEYGIFSCGMQDLIP